MWFLFILSSYFNLDCVRSGNFWGRGPESYTISIDYPNVWIIYLITTLSLSQLTRSDVPYRGLERISW